MINFKKPATNIQLYEISDLIKLPIIILMKDELNKNNFKTHKCFILNLENSNEDGSHWVAFYRNKRQVFYYDPFAFPPATEFYEIFMKQNNSFFYSIRQTQPVKSILCGYYCLYFLYFMYNSKNKNQKDSFNNFLNSFYINLNRNDKVVKDFFKSII